MNVTEVDLTALSDDRLTEFGERLERLAWQQVRLPAHDPRYARTEHLIRLVEAEEERRFGPE